MQTILENILSRGGLTYKKVWVGGSSVIITCWSQDAADKIASVLRASGYKIRGVVKSIDYNAENENTMNNPTNHNVWRVGAVVQ